MKNEVREGMSKQTRENPRPRNNGSGEEEVKEVWLKGVGSKMMGDWGFGKNKKSPISMNQWLI